MFFVVSMFLFRPLAGFMCLSANECMYVCICMVVVCKRGSTAATSCCVSSRIPMQKMVVRNGMWNMAKWSYGAYSNAQLWCRIMSYQSHFSSSSSSFCSVKVVCVKCAAVGNHAPMKRRPLLSPLLVVRSSCALVGMVSVSDPVSSVSSSFS